MTTRTRKSPASRRLTIGCQYYEQRRNDEWRPPRTVPALRLSGDWLQRAGFEIGEKVRLRITGRKITITPSVNGG